MNELQDLKDAPIAINYDTAAAPTVSGRELHGALEIETPYHKWFPRMCEYGFAEGEDFNTDKNVRVQTEGDRQVAREITDHQLTIPMAKEICMLQRNDKGKQFRQYFIRVEEAWNSPEMIMKRALEIANRKVQELETTVAVRDQQISELTPKASYYDVVLSCKDAISTTEIAKDYGKSAKWLNKLLHEKGIQFRQGDIWLLYQKYAEKGYTITKTQTYSGNDGAVHSKLHTYWTQKGRLFIYETLKTAGILPTIERG